MAERFNSLEDAKKLEYLSLHEQAERINALLLLKRKR